MQDACSGKNWGKTGLSHLMSYDLLVRPNSHNLPVKIGVHISSITGRPK